MASLKIRIYKGGGTEPDTTITIPLAIFRVAAKMIPQKALSTLQEKGIDADLIVALSQKDDVRGTIVEIEEHKKNEKVIIAIE